MGAVIRKAGENWVPLSVLMTIVSATWVIRGGIEAARADWKQTVLELRADSEKRGAELMVLINERTSRRWDVEMEAVGWEYYKNTGDTPNVRAIKAAVEASRE